MPRLLNTLVLYVLVLVSFALHLATIGGLMAARATAKDELSSLADQMGSVEQQMFTLTVKIKQDVPINATFPIQKSIVIPVNTTVNIDQIVAVPINTPLGTANINVPLKTTVPINTTVPVTISDTVTVNTTVSIDLSVPVGIAVADTPFADLVRALRRKLIDLNQKF